MKIENFTIDFENPIANQDNTSNVYKAIDNSSKMEYAIKKVSNMDDIDKTIEIFENLNDCENSVKYFGSFYDKETKYIVMELCDFSLAHKIKQKTQNKDRYDIKEIKLIFSDINNALEKMREKKYIHGNLKPENILAKRINGKLIYKISDYGTSQQSNKEEIIKYRAPEYDDPHVVNKSKVDLWSIGMILYEMYFGVIPQLPIERKKLAKSESEFFDDLIRKLLIEKPFMKKGEKYENEEEEEEEEEDNRIRRIRITWDEYFKHDFFKNSYLKEMKYLKYSFNEFKGEVKKIVGYINSRFKEFKNVIIKEEDELYSDENNEKIKNFSRLLKEYKFANNEQSVNKFFNLTQYSILNNNPTNEYIEFSNKELITYHGEVIKGTTIKNGVGKEYYLNGELKYEGEYLNDKRDGKGKEYTEEGELIFQGNYKEGQHWNGIKKIFEEYEDEDEQKVKYVKYIGQIKKGKMSGKCKEFDIEGNLIYEGEYSEGKKNGNGRLYDINGNVEFEGEFKDDKKINGNANEYNSKGNLLFYGVYQNGERYNGRACKYFDNGEKLRYEIEYKDGLLWNVKGYNKKEIFSKFDFEIKNGDGTMKDYYSDDILKFNGSYKEGKKNGKVYSYYNNPNTRIESEGEYIDDVKNGEWKMYYDNGNQEFVGNFKNGVKHGKCKEYNEFGKMTFDGEYNEGVKWKGKERIIYECNKKKIVIERKYDSGKAKCVEYYEHIKFDPKNFDIKGLEFIEELIFQGNDKEDFSEEINYESYITNLLFVGDYIDDKSIKDKTKRNGTGIEYHENKSIFEGEYKEGKIIKGKGKIYNNDGNLLFEGEYIDGKRNGKVIEYYENTDNDTQQKENSELLIKYEGYYTDDQKNGEGKEFLYDEENQPEIVFEGIYKNGVKWNGMGKEYYKMPDKLLFTGEYREGKRWNGNFFEYSKIMDRIKSQGKYVEGKKVDVKKNEEFEFLNFD